jgi:tyrosyl-tRNA synthetase
MALAHHAARRALADRGRRRRHGSDRRSEAARPWSGSCSRAEQVEQNVEGIRGQLARFLDFDEHDGPARLVNNAEWLTTLGAIEFMRDVGKHFTVNAMLAKGVGASARIESEEASPTPSSAIAAAGLRLLELFDRFGCTLQMGGSDQWGNIVAGMDSDSTRARRQGRTAWCCR